jgi:quercetin dioxygenase-like cupin family protein
MKTEKNSARRAHTQQGDMISMRIRAWVVRVLMIGGALACVPAMGAEAMKHVMKGPRTAASPDIQWRKSPTVAGDVQMVMLFGSPDQPGPYIFRVHFPVGYKLAPHRHPDQRQVTVLTGNYWSAVGETFEQGKLQKFGPGDYYITEPNIPHYAWAETEVVIQEMGFGPVSNSIEYVNAADDPRK